MDNRAKAGQAKADVPLSNPFRSTAGTRVVSLFRRLRLETQFILIASLVVLALMVTLAILTTNRLERAVLNTAGSLGAASLETLVAPLISSEDIERGELAPAIERQLGDLVAASALGQHVHELKIWRPDGSILYSSSGLSVTEKVVFDELKRALSGEIVVGRTEIQKHKYANGAQRDTSIEIYAPLIRDAGGRVILVGEFYERPDVLLQELSDAWLSTVRCVLLITVPMLALLFLIVRRGSRLIDQQHDAIRRSLTRAVELSNQNCRLRSAADNARLEAGKLNEMILNQIGSDLHDGPVQLLTLVKLRLSDLAGADGGQSQGRQDSGKLVAIVSAVLEDLRSISSDLVLPELDDMPLTEAIQLAVSRHVDLTGRDVEVVGTIASSRIDAHLNICVYRFIQEALMNAERHAPGNRQRVQLATRRSFLFVRVSDVGHTAAEQARGGSAGRSSIGTVAQKRRVRAFGGRMRTVRLDNGTVVTAVLPLDQSHGLVDR
ncbi:sensor histidine kinase [Ensifer adhaerens]|uniref:sensor histidine kinase n=1 Tax=Ensifer adhaerens TaxID=106592 RepID=UPI00131A3088|nr:ATP-binding protein [Ensifer adhaerens]